MQQYDVIVVGAGNGGMVAAALTAKAGLKTLLLEKHNLPGGCATSFRRGRFEFEPSLHELCGVGTKENPSAVWQLFDELGIQPDWFYEENAFRVISKCPGGFDVTLKAGRDGFLDSLEEAVPGSRKSAEAFLDTNRKIDEALAYMDAHPIPNPAILLTKHIDFVRVASHSAEEVEDALMMPQKAKDIINTYWCYLGVPTDELNALHFLSMVAGYVLDKPAMPGKKSHELSSMLVDVIRKNGGEVRFNCPVSEFLYSDDGGVRGVIAGGEELTAKEIISNVIPDNVLRMSDPAKVDARSRKLASARNFGISIATVYLGLDCTAEELGIKDYTIFITNSRDPRKQYENRQDKGLYIVNCLNTVVPDCTPEGTSTLFFSIPMFGGDMPADLKPQDYKKWKNELAKTYIEDFEQTLGVDVRSHIEEISVATPVTFARYLGTPDGTIYGYRVDKWDNIIARTAMEAADFNTPHLSYCGGHHIRGDGYSSAYASGRMTAEKVIARIKEGK